VIRCVLCIINAGLAICDSSEDDSLASRRSLLSASRGLSWPVPHPRESHAIPNNRPTIRRRLLPGFRPRTHADAVERAWSS
jgi:hypothetical protein